MKPFAYLLKSYHQNSNASGVNSTCNSRISGLKFILIPRISGHAPQCTRRHGERTSGRRQTVMK